MWVVAEAMDMRRERLLSGLCQLSRVLRLWKEEVGTGGRHVSLQSGCGDDCDYLVNIYWAMA